MSLEIEGNFASMGVDPGLLYEAEVRDLAGTGTPGTAKTAEAAESAD